MASAEVSTHETTPPTSESTSDVESDEEGDVPSEEVKDQMVKATKEGDLSTLKNILEPNPNFVNTKFDYKDDKYNFPDCTLLHISALHGHVNILDYLVCINADIHAVDRDGGTVLHAASIGGVLEVIKYLLEKGLDIDQVDNDGLTPLYCAVANAKLEAAQLLTERGTNIHAITKDGVTVLHGAAAGRKLENIEYLLEKGLDINQVTNDGVTVLHYAALGGKLEIIKYLLEKGLDINQVDNDGDTPLHCAIDVGKLKAVKFLTANGADIYIINKNGETPLIYAVNRNKGSVVKYLINECKMDITQLDQEMQSKINEMLQEESSPESSSTEDDDEIDANNGADDNKEEMQRAYSLALSEGEAQSSSVSIYVLGQQSAGKTCLVASLLGDKFEENVATQGADLEVCTIFASQWSRIEKKKIPKQLQKRYHCKLKVTAEIKITAERKKPVLKAQNKQQLLESMPELPEAVKADLEQAKTAVLIDEDGINAIIWDFAGQSVYYGLHSMFLKEDNVAMIVFDASQDLHDATKGRSGLKDPYTQKSINPVTTGYESVCYWLKSIHSICRKDGASVGAKSKFVPTVFLVATHIDLIGDEKAIARRRQEIIDQLFLALRGKPYAKHLAGIEGGLREALERNCFFISNKVRDQKELNRLRALLVEASSYITSRQHPVVYLNIERRLLSFTKMVISIVEFHRIAKDSGFFAEPQSPESIGALAHFHNKGTILHFPQAESLKDIIVLSPDWLTKLFAYTVVAHPYKPGLDYDLQFDRLKNQGILDEDFVAYMVKKFNKEQEKFGLPLTAEQAIGFAELFGFITEVNNNTYFLEEAEQPPTSESKVFIVPPMLPLELPDDIKLPEDSDLQVRAVYFKFSEGFIPPMVYYQILGACIDRNIKREEDLYWIRRHIIKLVLGHDQLYYVSLCEDLDSIRLVITPDISKTVTLRGLQERWMLIEYFNTKLMEIVKTFMPASDLPQRYIPCYRCPKLHLKLDDIRKGDRPLHCVHGRLDEGYYRDLRKYQETNISDKGVATGDSEWIFKQEPRLKQLVSYLKKLIDWETFGTLLLPDGEDHLVEEIKVNNEGKGVKSYKMALYRTFLKCGVKTWETVINALDESDNESIAKDLKTKLLNEFIQL